MSPKIETLYGYNRTCNYCGKFCTIGVTNPKNSVIYLPVINNKTIYDYATPGNFIDTICFSPSVALFEAFKITILCHDNKTR